MDRLPLVSQGTLGNSRKGKKKLPFKGKKAPAETGSGRGGHLFGIERKHKRKKGTKRRQTGQNITKVKRRES